VIHERGYEELKYLGKIQAEIQYVLEAQLPEATDNSRK